MDEKSQVYKICLEMLDQRGFHIIKQTDEKYTFEVNNNRGDKICVIFSDNSKFGIKVIKNYLILKLYRMVFLI